MLAAILTATLALTAGEVELLQFTSPHCPACQTMAPIVNRLAESGIAVKKIDVQAREDLARQFRVRVLPTTIAVQQGREIDRVEGAVSFDRITAMLPNSANPSTGTPALLASSRMTSAEPNQLRQPAFAPPGNPTAAATAPPRAANPQQHAYGATVRLKVFDGKGYGVGTGTIIDRHGEEALVMTCAHVFRESQGKGEIQVDLFAKPGTTVKGQLIDSDMHRDVALVAIRPGIEVPVVPVAGPDYKSQPGERVFTVGCNKGQDPTVVESHITAVNKYNSRPNVTVKGQPVDGRSGGGLFTADGQLIGICNAADGVDDEGLYASLPAVHWQLDKIGQKRIYDRPAANANTALVSTTAAPMIPEQMPKFNVPPVASSQQIPADDLEVFCIVRRKSQPHLPPQSFPLDRLPPEIAARLNSAPPADAGRGPERISAAPASNGLIIRGQQER